MRGRIVLFSVMMMVTSGCAARDPGNRAAVAAAQREQTPERLIARGRSAASIGDFTRAEQYLTAALQSGGDETVIMPLLLHVCVAGERYRVAIDYVRNYLRSHPEDLRLRSLLGSLEWAVGEREAARSDLRSVLQKAPGEADAHFVLATVLDEDGRGDEASNHYREYLRLKPTGPHAPQARARLEEGEGER